MLIEDNDDLINRMNTEILAVEALRNQAQSLVNDYRNVYESAANAVIQLQSFVQAEQAAAASYRATADAYEDMIHRVQRANADYVANPLGGYHVESSGSGSGSGSGGGSGSGSGGGSGSGSGTEKSPTAAKQNERPVGYAWYRDKDKKVHADKWVRYNTGGYTGDWSTDDPRLALVDRKELVLNKNDTENFLKGTYILRKISDSLEGNLFNRINSIGLKSPFDTTEKEEIQQNVHIDASFPNVDSKREIEEAFTDLVNLAAQRAMR
jgi:hypothetical protein